ncbi:MAG: YraN family protein [Saccharofermentanales bacterium]|jgi:Holliday junction resolvase-like predicted endonuclease|nr:YraN family protein [Clostridiaceae bacterium]
MRTLTCKQNIIKGQVAEQAAVDYLVGLGYQILARNYRVHRLGELDLIAELEGKLTVVEVKARHRADLYGGLESSITPAKLRRIRRTTSFYLQENRLMHKDVYILAIFVKIDQWGKSTELSVVPIEWR